MSTIETPPICLNSLGYLPAQRKRATISVPCERFAVRDDVTGAVVYEGELQEARTDAAAGAATWTADFTAVEAEGTYRIECSPAIVSAPFRIAADIYRFPFYTATRAMSLWRCGVAVSAVHNGVTFSQRACHRDDGYLRFVGDSEPETSPFHSKHIRKDATGGWHDAGDYNKYVVNAGVTVSSMLLAFEHFPGPLSEFSLDLPERDAQGDDDSARLPDILAEVKWELDWLLKMQFPDGRVSHKLTTRDFCGFIMPDEEKQERYFTPWSTSATADFAAMVAAASVTYAPYRPEFAARCLDAARLSYEALREHPDDFEGDLSPFSTGGYGSPDAGHRLWAAAELWRATGEAAYLSDFEVRAKACDPLVDTHWDWATMKNHGLFAYLHCSRPGKDAGLNAAIERSVIEAADGIVETADAHAYGRPLGSVYHWGGNGSVARQAILLQIAHSLKPDPSYRETALDALGYLFGRNPFGRSFVTGLGHNPPMHPHDRRSGADGIDDPWPGYLVGGAWPRAVDWYDVEEDYRTNEIAINWNAALIYALAGFVNPERA